jgi:ferrochelatase
MTTDTGVILLNLGGPDSLAAVRPFLYNLFSDRDIIRLGPAPLQKPIAWLISTTRAPKSRGYYMQIGGRSPILDITRDQARALERALAPSGPSRVYVGMRYWHPFVEETVRQMASDGVRRLISLSLYPHYSKTTTGSSEAALKDALKGTGIECGFVSSWYDHPGYVGSLVEVINNALAAVPGAHLLFSAHSLPVKFIEEGDPYVREITGTIEAVMKKVSAPWSLGYQSRSGPVKWLEPPTEEVIKRLASEGVKDVLVVPISFVSDHIETLYEVDILYRGIAEPLGIKLRRVEALNTRPTFIGALRDLVTRKAEALGWL